MHNKHILYTENCFSYFTTGRVSKQRGIGFTDLGGMMRYITFPNAPIVAQRTLPQMIKLVQHAVEHIDEKQKQSMGCKVDFTGSVYSVNRAKMTLDHFHHTTLDFIVARNKGKIYIVLEKPGIGCVFSNTYDYREGLRVLDTLEYIFYLASEKTGINK